MKMINKSIITTTNLNMNKPTLNFTSLKISSNITTIIKASNSKKVSLIIMRTHLLKTLHRSYNKTIKAKIMVIRSKKGHNKRLFNNPNIRIINQADLKTNTKIISNTSNKVSKKIDKMLIKNIMAMSIIINRKSTMKCSAESL